MTELILLALQTGAAGPPTLPRGGLRDVGGKSRAGSAQAPAPGPRTAFPLDGGSAGSLGDSGGANAKRWKPGDENTAGCERLPWKQDWKFLEHSNPSSAASVDGSRALSQTACRRHFNGKVWIFYFTAPQAAFIFLFFFFQGSGVVFHRDEKRRQMGPLT